VVERVYAFEEVPEAVKRLQSGRVRGKVVVAVGREVEGGGHDGRL